MVYETGNFRSLITAIAVILLPMSIYNAPAPDINSPLFDLLMRDYSSSSMLINQRNKLAAEIKNSYRNKVSPEIRIQPEMLQALHKIESTPLVFHFLSHPSKFNELRKMRFQINLFKEGLKNKFKHIEENNLKRESIFLELQKIDFILKKVLGFSADPIRNDYFNPIFDRISVSDLQKKTTLKIKSVLDSLKIDTPHSSIPIFPTRNMALPVSGPLIKLSGEPFPKGRVPWAGIMIKSKPNTSVKAVGPGEIVFAADFNKLRNLIVLDHGNNFLTLYGNLETIAVTPGMRLQKGRIIGTSPDKIANQETGVYFEIRKNGVPVDPKLWFKY